MWSVAVYFAGRILTCRSSSRAQPFLSLHFFLFIFYYTALLPPSFHFPLSVILSAPRSNFGSMEPRGALSQSYLHPRLSSSSSRSSSTSSSSSSPLPLVQEGSSMRILWCTRAGEFVFSSSLYFCCVVSGGKWWRGCSSITLQPIPSITSQFMEIHTATRSHWFLPALGFAHSIWLVRTERMFSAPEETNFFFYLSQHTSHCFRSKVLCMDQNSRWCRPESHILIFFFSFWGKQRRVFFKPAVEATTLQKRILSEVSVTCHHSRTMGQSQLELQENWKGERLPAKIRLQP